MLADSASTPPNVNVSKIDLEQRDVVVGLINFAMSCRWSQEHENPGCFVPASDREWGTKQEHVPFRISTDAYRQSHRVRRNRPGQARAPAGGRQSKAQRMEGDRHGQLSESRPLFLCAARSAPRLAPPPNPFTHDAPRAPVPRPIPCSFHAARTLA